MEDVYGPPSFWDPDLEETPEETAGETKAEILPAPSFNPEDEIPEAVYGPPEWFEPIPVEPSEYDPDSNMMQLMYGPPSYFEKGMEN